MIEFGNAKFARFKTLNASARNCNVTLSRIGILLNKDVSTLNKFGPRSELRPALPKVPAVGIEKARASNQCSGVPRITGPLKFGFLSATSVGCVPSPVPELLKPIRGVIGNPV